MPPLPIRNRSKLAAKHRGFLSIETGKMGKRVNFREEMRSIRLGDLKGLLA
jgi:hypothetical protein